MRYNSWDLLLVAIVSACLGAGVSQGNTLVEMPDVSAKVSGFSLGQARILPAIANAVTGSADDSVQANWQAGALWQLYEEDWQFSLPAEYDGKVAGVDYNFVGSEKPLRHSSFLIDGLADGRRDGWTSMADEVALLSTQDFGFQEHPDPALAGVQPWQISGDRAAKILNHDAARGVVLKDGTILRQTKGEIAPLKGALLTLFGGGACLDWTGVLFEPGSRIEFEKDGEIGYATLNEICYPVLP